jgi:hypothetical protein
VWVYVSVRVWVGGWVGGSHLGARGKRWGVAGAYLPAGSSGQHALVIVPQSPKRYHPQYSILGRRGLCLTGTHIENHRHPINAHIHTQRMINQRPPPQLALDWTNQSSCVRLRERERERDSVCVCVCVCVCANVM